jgi:hypothetical protein
MTRRTGNNYSGARWTHSTRRTIRVPARLSFFMDGTGWGQGAEAVQDEPRLTLLAMMDLHRAVVIRDPSDALLARLRWEADHLMDSYRYGDHNADTLADYNSGRAVVRAVGRLVDWPASEDHERMKES